MQNIEIKAHIRDISVAEKICKELNAVFAGIDHQTDTYFKVNDGFLKLRQSTLSGTFLVPYFRSDLQGPVKSDYVKIQIKDPILTQTLLSKILGIDNTVKKKRKIFLVDNVRIHLDEVESLGSFLELEAVFDIDTQKQRQIEEKKIEGLIEAFNIKKEDLEFNSYTKLLKKL